MDKWRTSSCRYIGSQTLIVLAVVVAQTSAHAQSKTDLLTQAAAPTRNWNGEVGVYAAETFSDNIARQSSALKRADWATEVSPYIQATGQSARAKGTLDARLQNFLHTDSQTGNRTDLQLAGSGSLELYEDHFFVDAMLSNDRQQISQFQAPDASYGGTNNSTEVTRFSVSPYLRWRIGSGTNAALRYRFEKVNSDTSFASGQNDSTTFDLLNGSAFQNLGWAFNLSRDNSEGESTQSNTISRYSGSLLYQLTPALVATLSGGQEFEDFQSGTRQHTWNWGGGLRWKPDERTTAVAETSKRFFGRGFNYQLSERFERSALEWSYARDLSVFSGIQPLGTTYSLSNSSVSRYLQQYNAEYASLDSSLSATERDQITKQYLAAQGISIFDLTQLDYLSGQSSIDKNMRLAWVLNGVRNSLTVAGHTSDRETVSQNGVVQTGDDLSTHQKVKARGWDATWSHYVSALTTFAVRYAYTDTTGTTTTNAVTSTRSDSIGANLDTKLGPYTTGGMTYNYTRSTGSADYRENAVAVYLNHRF